MLPARWPGAGHPARVSAERGDEPIPLARPVIGEREEELVLETLRSRQIGIGPRVAEFEQRLGERLGAGHVSAISSGTAALHLAVRASGIEPGDEVVTSPFSLRGLGQLRALRGRAARCSATSTRAR